ncbi:DUF2152 domain containing protein [Trichuris trichiura]|uniref:DUF2152 domain containing protein n=1 Tax=Trichuris trichiura TaxID=36087 RepID=A0A077Z090_TRITR|nr:DUF2152 domain containing protein [Trichuris trichiura]
MRIFMFPSKNSDLEDGACFPIFEHQIRPYLKEVADGDTAIRYFPSTSMYHHSQWLPFVGNGHFAISLMQPEVLLIKHPQTDRFINTGINPLLKVALKRSYSSALGAYVTRFTKGVVEKIECFSFDGHCIRVRSLFYAHRVLPHVFMEEISFHNPTREVASFSLVRQDHSWYRRLVKAVYPSQKVPLGMTAYDGFAQSPTGTVSFTMMSQDAASTFNVAPGKSPVNNGVNVASVQSYEEHLSAWKQLWISGFSIAHSRAPASINGDLINATIYYLLSSYPLRPNQVNLNVPISARPHHCYSSHTTLLYPSQLWSSLDSLDSILSTVSRWNFTLVEHGCESLVFSGYFFLFIISFLEVITSGAAGLMQAVVLSFGAFKHTAHHLEFDQQPRELHRDCLFRNVQFVKGIAVNIWVQVNADDKAVLYVNVNRTETKGNALLACDAGCLDNPIELRYVVWLLCIIFITLLLSADRSMIPLKLTDPPTPILYITDDRSHFDYLKMSIHVREVADAPAHEHHVIAMHKHGHRLGGLPMIFWLTLGVLLVIFHLFLLKLIYNEYKGGGGGRKAYTAFKYSAKR